MENVSFSTDDYEIMTINNKFENITIIMVVSARNKIA